MLSVSRELLFCLIVFITVTRLSSNNTRPKRDFSVTFHGFDDILKEGKVYRIDNIHGLTLTAEYEDKLMPAPTILSVWDKQPNQLWEVHHVDEGVILTPKKNDYNEVTSFIERFASANHVWNLGRPGVAVLNQGFSLNEFYMLRNQKLSCLRGYGEDEPVEFKPCMKSSPNQYWKFHEIKIQARSLLKK